MKERKELNIQIGSRIKQSREHSGLTQEKLAEKIDVSVQYVSDLERGIVGTSIPTLLKICDTLSVSTDYILKEEYFGEDDFSLIHRLKNLASEELRLVEKMLT